MQIKPLEWRAEPPYHVARIFGNLYAIEPWEGKATLSGVGGLREFNTVSEAKAAAQADYERRVRSILVDTAKSDADLIKQTVRLALANLDPSGADRLPLDEWVDQTLRAMGSATTSTGGDHD